MKEIDSRFLPRAKIEKYGFDNEVNESEPFNLELENEITILTSLLKDI